MAMGVIFLRLLFLLLHAVMVILTSTSPSQPSGSQIKYVQGYAVQQVQCFVPWAQQPLYPLVVSSEPIEHDHAANFSPQSVSSSDCVISDLQGMRLHFTSLYFTSLHFTSLRFIFHCTLPTRSLWRFKCFAFIVRRN